MPRLRTKIQRALSLLTVRSALLEVPGDPQQLHETLGVLLRLGVRLGERRLEADALPLAGLRVPAVVADLEVPREDAQLVVQLVGRVTGRRVQDVRDRA